MYLMYSLSRFASEITLMHSPDFLLSLSVVLSSTTCFTRIISTNTLSDMISSLAVSTHPFLNSHSVPVLLENSFSVSLPFSLFFVFCRPSHVTLSSIYTYCTVITTRRNFTQYRSRSLHTYIHHYT